MDEPGERSLAHRGEQTGHGRVESGRRVGQRSLGGEVRWLVDHHDVVVEMEEPLPVERRGALRDASPLDECHEKLLAKGEDPAGIGDAPTVERHAAGGERGLGDVRREAPSSGQQGEQCRPRFGGADDEPEPLGERARGVQAVALGPEVSVPAETGVLLAGAASLLPPPDDDDPPPDELP